MEPEQVHGCGAVSECFLDDGKISAVYQRPDPVCGCGQGGALYLHSGIADASDHTGLSALGEAVI